MNNTLRKLQVSLGRIYAASRKAPIPADEFDSTVKKDVAILAQFIEQACKLSDENEHLKKQVEELSKKPDDLDKKE